MIGYTVAGRYFGLLGAAIQYAAATSASVFRGHRVVWSPCR